MEVRRKLRGEEEAKRPKSTEEQCYDDWALRYKAHVKKLRQMGEEPGVEGYKSDPGVERRYEFAYAYEPAPPRYVVAYQALEQLAQESDEIPGAKLAREIFPLLQPLVGLHTHFGWVTQIETNFRWSPTEEEKVAFAACGWEWLRTRGGLPCWQPMGEHSPGREVMPTLPGWEEAHRAIEEHERALVKSHAEAYDLGDWLDP
jgi:hypothetical protein